MREKMSMMRLRTMLMGWRVPSGSGVGRARQVQIALGLSLLLGGHGVAQRLQTFLGGLLERIDLHAHFALQLVRHGAKIVHQFAHLALFCSSI